MNIGKTIREIRKKKGFRQNAFAEKCNLSAAYLSQIENGQKDPNLSTLKEISTQLEIPLPVLFFLSLDETDIPEKKKEAFNHISPYLKKHVYDLFMQTDKSNSN